MKIRSCSITALLLTAMLLISTSSTAAAPILFDEDSSNEPYYIGKIIYHQKLACSGCPLSEIIIDISMYKSIIQRLNNEEQLMNLLSEDERSAVTYYIEKLFAPRTN